MTYPLLLGSDELFVYMYLYVISIMWDIFDVEAVDRRNLISDRKKKSG